MSIVESLIASQEFDYLRPYFYTNTNALRCELGIGTTDDEYEQQAQSRAASIYEILFQSGADAFFFEYWVYDYSSTGEADKENDTDTTEYTIECELKKLRFLLECQKRYRHTVVKNLKTYFEAEDDDWDDIRRNRIICYSGNDPENDIKLINQQISDGDSFEISLVSFENECIMSVYDDRGCDIVFASFEKMKTFYSLLEPFFLEYDREEMQRRLSSNG